MDLSIIIVNYRSRGLVKQCLKSLAVHPPKVEHEIIVVDNGSFDGTDEMTAKKFPHVKFIQTGRNGGLAFGNNAGLRVAQGRYLFIINPDISVQSGAIDTLYEFMEKNREVGVVGPKLLRPNGEIDESCYRFPTCFVPVFRRTPLGKFGVGRKAVADYLMADYDRAECRAVDWLLGAALFVRRDALDEVGPLDESIFLYFEDTDWCRRFWEANWQVAYYPEAQMVHLHDRLSAQAPWYMAPFHRPTRIHVESAVKYFRKWPDSKPGQRKKKS